MKLSEKIRSPVGVWLLASILPFVIMSALVFVGYDMPWFEFFPEPFNQLTFFLAMMLPSYLVFLMRTGAIKEKLSSIGFFTMLQPLYLGALIAFAIVCSCAVHGHCP